MQLCENCGSLSPTGAERCVSCRMENSCKTPLATQQESAESEQIQCINCGSFFRTLHEKCPDCRFPKTAKTIQSAGTDQHIISLGRRKAG